MKYLSRALIALACAAVPAAASAGTTIYTDAGAFAAATTGAVTDQFENAATGGYTNYSAGYSGAGLTVLSDSGLLYDFDAAFHPEYYDWGSGDVMTYGYLGAATFYIAGGTTAFSIDLMSVFDYGAPIWVSVLGDTYVIDTADYPTETFFGITSDTPITSFSLASYSSQGEFDNFTLATAISAAPEPGTWAMMLIGFAAIGWAMRRRGKSGASPQLA